jgi:hypothetical protein
VALILRQPERARDIRHVPPLRQVTWRVY